jgi:hypothetical protein
VNLSYFWGSGNQTASFNWSDDVTWNQMCSWLSPVRGDTWSTVIDTFHCSPLGISRSKTTKAWDMNRLTCIVVPVCWPRTPETVVFIESEGFWRWCMSLRTTGLMDFVHRPNFWITRKHMISSSSQGGNTYSVGSLELTSTLYPCGVNPVALLTYDIQTYYIYIYIYIYMIRNRNSSISSLHVSAPTGPKK